MLHLLFLALHFCFQIPLPVLAAQTFVSAPSTASAAAHAAPKYRTIAVEFDDHHNQERVHPR
jgi:hypothetical protein